MKQNGFLTGLTKYFLPEYYAQDYGREDRFPSVVTALFRFMLRHPKFMFALNLAWAMIRGIVTQQPFFTLIFAGVLTACLSTVAVYLGMVVLMGFESLARIMACLILYGDLPKGAENVVDSFITYVVRGKRPRRRR